MMTAAASLPSASTSPARHDWYLDSKASLNAASKVVTSAFRRCHLDPTSSRARRRLRSARRALRRAKRASLDKWIFTVTSGVNRGSWASVNQLSQGHRNFAARHPMQFSQDDMVSYLHRHFNASRPATDPTYASRLRQRDVRWDLDALPSMLELEAAIRASKPGTSALGSPFPHFHALLTDRGLRRVALRVLQTLWISGTWVSGQRPCLASRFEAPDWGDLSPEDKIDLALSYHLRVRFVQENPKTPGSGSHARYNLYKRAQTLTRALQLGAIPGDLAWDLQRGFYSIFPEPLQRPVSWVDTPDTEEQWVPDWSTLRCTLLYKGSGKPLNQLSSWRSIMVMHSFASLLGGIMNTRLQSVQTRHGPEPQNGFTAHRGHQDSLYSQETAIRKRLEHGLDTWAAYIDWVAGFDTVDHSVLWPVLEKYGLPPHFLQVLRRFYSGCTFKVRYDGHAAVVIPYTAGVKQGCRMSPTLWNFMIAAIMEVALPSFRGVLCFRTSLRLPSKPSGTRWRNQGTFRGSFQLTHVVQSDDTALFADSRPSLSHNLRMLQFVAMKFGTVIHSSVNGSDSKSKCMAYPAPASTGYLDLSPIPLLDGSSVPFELGSIRYLGQLHDPTLSSSVAVRARIDKANQKFGALGSVFRSRKVSRAAKIRCYEAVILPTLLFGAHTWILRAGDWRLLENYHHARVRQMANVNLWLTRRHRISTRKLLGRLRLRTMRQYVARAALAWVGKCVQMEAFRLPRQLLFSWIRRPRSPHATKTHGAMIREHLRCCLLPEDPDSWIPIAQTASLWRQTIKDNLDSTRPH